MSNWNFSIHRNYATVKQPRKLIKSNIYRILYALEFVENWVLSDKEFLKADNFCYNLVTPIRKCKKHHFHSKRCRYWKKSSLCRRKWHYDNSLPNQNRTSKKNTKERVWITPLAKFLNNISRHRNATAFLIWNSGIFVPKHLRTDL